MTLDSRIILSGRTPNFLETLYRANEEGQKQIARRQQNALAQLMQEQGAGIMRGEEGALAQLAQYDPSAALNIQNQRQGLERGNLQMEATRLGMDQTRQSMRIAAERHADIKAQAAQAAQAHILEAKTAQQKAKMEADARTATKIAQAGLSAQTPDQFDQIMRTAGRSDLVGMFENREMIAAQAVGIEEQLEVFRSQQEAQQPLSPKDRYRTVGGQVVDLAAEGGPRSVFQAEKQPSGIRLSTDPATGQVTFEQGTIAGSGGRVANSNLNETESKGNIYYTRALGALDDFEPIANAMAGPVDRVADAVPLVGNYLTSEDYQVATTAGKEFLAAILRKDTGAAITNQEMKEYGDIYLPAPGDKGPRLAQKKKARARALRAMEMGMSLDQIVAMEPLFEEREEALNSQDSPGVEQSEPVVIDGYTIQVVK